MAGGAGEVVQGAAVSEIGGGEVIGSQQRLVMSDELAGFVVGGPNLAPNLLEPAIDIGVMKPADLTHVKRGEVTARDLAFAGANSFEQRPCERGTGCQGGEDFRALIRGGVPVTGHEALAKLRIIEQCETAGGESRQFRDGEELFGEEAKAGRAVFDQCV
jgi:hypothetical protein